ncbi:hypothetical protein HPB51_018904 [Rhipicephalus microplus]|uniref:THAP-type domain-containing protein n=1 Tax=Rhipicephalus microplus TaxID=6941 RepID=A0A9J6D6C3_RHIMP|nr:hypothetical protein HPB51_018904 [Rhipicephalus microplus]
MGKKCIAPRCKTGYKSCTKKLSLFSAPREEERLLVWRNAIPRKDRILQSTDHLCERHFEPHLVSKTWEAVYNGNVLCRAPRKASLSKDAVPTIFPDCPSYLSKEKNNARGQLRNVTSTGLSRSTVSKARNSATRFCWILPKVVLLLRTCSCIIVPLHPWQRCQLLMNCLEAQHPLSFRPAPRASTDCRLTSFAMLCSRNCGAFENRSAPLTQAT